MKTLLRATTLFVMMITILSSCGTKKNNSNSESRKELQKDADKVSNELDTQSP